MSDYEDASPSAKEQYVAWGLPADLTKIRASDQLLQKWTALKTQTLDNFALSLAAEVRKQQPSLLTARNLYAQVALKAYAENWYAQSLENSLRNYDFTAIMAMPYMEQAKNPDQFYADM
ncbi:poly-beta-1,6-N-acetyl-D-glucosamine N-deacetylase PgaB, partial [Rhizobium hidalgonense]